MKSFLKFLTEGGNVIIGDVEADRLDMDELPRHKLIPVIVDGLKSINKEFEKKTGLTLWKPELFKDLSFLSGSSIHFLDQSIDDERFKTHKPKVGDIDTQVDKTFEKELKAFLDSFSGKAGELRFVGFKKSADQFVTLWNITPFDVNVQLDLELSDFEDGRPTPWSQFSHSSAWEDIEEGIKGVFHKFAIRAATHYGAHNEVIVRTPSGKKENVVKTNKMSFSVTKGLRKKIEPVLDEKGEQLMKRGMPVFQEIPTSKASYTSDLEVIFRTLFGREMQSGDMGRFNSFMGLLQIINKEWDKKNKQTFAEAFADLLWNNSAQGIVRGEPNEDRAIKMAAWENILSILKIKETKEISNMRTKYYENY